MPVDPGAIAARLSGGGGPSWALGAAVLAGQEQARETWTPPAAGTFTSTRVRDMLRVCRKYGQDPFTWWDSLEPSQQALLMADEAIGTGEDVQRGER